MNCSWNCRTRGTESKTEKIMIYTRPYITEALASASKRLGKSRNELIGQILEATLTEAGYIEDEWESESRITSQEWEAALRFFEDRCAYCGAKSTRPLQQDHFIPQSKGGNLSAKNVIPACCSCNASKGGRDPWAWYKGQPFFTNQKAEKIKDYLGGK